MNMDHMHGGSSSSSSNLTDSRFTHTCSMNMLWNWEVVDSCFISDQWHVTNEVGFAFSIIGIFLITLLIEGVRRAARNYDRILAAKHGTLSKNGTQLRPTMSEQLTRGTFYGVQFSAAYVLMLIAMSFNGFALFAIF
ncbi:Copper Transporter integral membrane protein that functions in high affinity copper transport, partial [Ceratobasidium sp. 423]